MRLDEFVNQKVLNELSFPDTFKGAVERLKSAGYNSLGSGYYGQVFEKPGSEYVLKVFSNRDRAYLDFVSVALNHQDNPHFPKIKGNIVKVNNAYSAVRTEKLKPNTDEITPACLDYYISGSLEYGIDADTIESQIPEIFDENPKIKDACDIISANLIKSKNHNSDLHADNIMLRGNTIVITDPVS